jgi:hypothetical protein
MSSSGEQSVGQGQASGSADGNGESDDDNDDPGDGDGHDDDAVEDEAEEEDEDEEAESSEDESEAADDAGAAAPPVAAAPVAPEGNWLSFDDLMNETYPAKSKAVYKAAYVKFELYLKSKKQFEPNVMPTEEMILNYFHYLHVEKFWGANTIWSTYSRLNAVIKRRFRKSLKEFPSITDMLKSYEVGHRVKKASVFTPQQECVI